MSGAGTATLALDRLQRTELLRRAGAFSLLDERELTSLAERMTVEHAALGDVIVESGEQADAMYIVVAGRARVVGTDFFGQETSLALLQPGDAFGETALLLEQPRNATVRAADSLTLLRLAATDLERVLARRDDVRTALRRFVADTGVQNFLKQCTALGELPARDLRTVITELQVVPVTKDQVVLRQGETGDRFYIVREGVFEAVIGEGNESRVVGQIGVGEFFGERALLTGEPRSATVVARSDGELYLMSKQAFDRIARSSPRFRARLEEQTELYRAIADRESARPVEPPVEAAAMRDADNDEPAPRARWRKALRRYPHISQNDETDCGAACLAMVLAYYGKRVGLARLRDLANVDSDGATMWSVAHAAEALGFHARGLQLSFEALRQLECPAIVHWEGVHYIVVYEVGRKHVLVSDPGLGRRRMSIEEFRAGWTGRALELTPTARLVATQERTGSLRRFIPIIRPHSTMVTEILLASLVLSALGLGIPLFTQMIIDRVLVNRSVDLLHMMLAGMVIVAVFQTVIGAVRRLLLVHVSTRCDARLMSDFFRHVFRLPMRFFDLRRVGDVLSRVSENKTIRQAMIGTIPGIMLDTVLAAGYIALMAYYSPKLTLIVLAVIPVFALLMVVFTPIIRRNRKEHFARHTDSWSYLIESITGMSTVKAMAVESNVRWKMDGLFVDSLLVSKRGAHIETLYSGLAGLLQTLASVLFLWYGAQQVLDHSMSVGQLLAFVTLAGSVIAPILRLIDAWDDLQNVRIAVDRLNDVFDADPEQERTETLLHLKQLHGQIRLDDVEFMYTPNQDEPTLAGVSVEIMPGETVAVVGRSGSGKSTFMKLIMGLYEPTKGRVLIDGHDMRAVALPTLRRRIGVVPQDVYLFAGTIRENIALGDPDLPFERVVEAARLAGAHDFICEMPLGYDSKTGERGMSLSGGQRQRLALARALVNDPRILLLDEATAALDNETERAIQRNLEEACNDRTTIIIAHRLTTVRNADRILVMDAGVIVEEGTHDDLLAQGGLYASLAGQQLEQ